MSKTEATTSDPALHNLDGLLAQLEALLQRRALTSRTLDAGDGYRRGVCKTAA